MMAIIPLIEGDRWEFYSGRAAAWMAIILSLLRVRRGSCTASWYVALDIDSPDSIGYVAPTLRDR